MSLRNLILNNFWQKVFSLVLAMLIWFAIDSNIKRDKPFPRLPSPVDQPTRDFRRPIKILTSADNTRAFKVEPKEVDVRISGNLQRVRSFNPDDIQPYVELSGVESNMTVAVHVNPPRDVTLELVWPTNVVVEPLPTLEPEL